MSKYKSIVVVLYSISMFFSLRNEDFFVRRQRDLLIYLGIVSTIASHTDKLREYLLRSHTLSKVKREVRAFNRCVVHYNITTHIT